tara:strand:- start:38 stop:238 length:201 start_codon:yes stop_codon:yes gene_type:complete
MECKTFWAGIKDCLKGTPTRPVILGGMGLATVFTLYLTPIAYLGMARFSKARAHSGQLLTDELKSL